MLPALMDLPKDIKLVHALMALRKVNTHDLSVHTGVQIENLHAWLQGAASAIAHRSYVSLLSYLGLTREGLSKSYVQNWELDGGSQIKSEQLQVLSQISTWLGGGSLMEIIGEWQPLLGKTRMFAIRGETFKILIAVKGGFRMPCAVTPDMIPGIAYRSTVDGKPPEIRVDPLYWNAVRNQAITPAEFDDLFFETALECSWNDLRLMARERGITPSMLAKDVLARDMEVEQQAITSALTTKKVETAVSHPELSVSAPPRTRRRAERVSVSAQVEGSASAAKTLVAPLPLYAGAQSLGTAFSAGSDNDDHNFLR